MMEARQRLCLFMSVPSASVLDLLMQVQKGQRRI